MKVQAFAIVEVADYGGSSNRKTAVPNGVQDGRSGIVVLCGDVFVCARPHHSRLDALRRCRSLV
jgi:hypothetical protein